MKICCCSNSQGGKRGILQAKDYKQIIILLYGIVAILRLFAPYKRLVNQLPCRDILALS